MQKYNSTFWCEFATEQIGTDQAVSTCYSINNKVKSYAKKVFEKRFERIMKNIIW